MQSAIRESVCGGGGGIVLLYLDTKKKQNKTKRNTKLLNVTETTGLFNGFICEGFFTLDSRDYTVW